MSLHFDRMALEGEQFLKALGAMLGNREDRPRTTRILRSVLHSIRDLLTIQESLQLLAQLPMFLKAVYVEGWTGRRTEGIRHLADLTAVLRRSDHTGPTDFPDEQAAKVAVHAVFGMLRQYASRGELENIAAQLPKELKSLVTKPMPVL